MGWGPALSYAEFVELCFKHKVVDDKELMDMIINGIRLRNIIIHRYIEVDYGKLYEESEKLEEMVKKFEKQVLTFVKD